MNKKLTIVAIALALTACGSDDDDHLIDGSLWKTAYRTNVNGTWLVCFYRGEGVYWERTFAYESDKQKCPSKSQQVRWNK